MLIIKSEKPWDAENVCLQKDDVVIFDRKKKILSIGLMSMMTATIFSCYSIVDSQNIEVILGAVSRVLYRVGNRFGSSVALSKMANKW